MTARRPTSSAVAGMAVLAVLGTLVSGCGSSTGPADTTTGPDDRAVLVAPSGDPTGAASSVQLPDGRVRVQVAAARELTDADLLPGHDEQVPPGEYVGVSWDFMPGKGIPADLSGLLTPVRADTSVSLLVAGKATPIGDVHGDDTTLGDTSAKLVPVPDGTEADDVGVEIVFDGASQRLTPSTGRREPGPAAGLYDLPTRLNDLPCRVGLRPTSVGDDAACELSTVQLPYLAGEGWAASGQVWTVVYAVTSLTRVAHSGQQVLTGRQSGLPTYDGLPADVTVEERSAGSGAWRTVTGYLTSGEGAIALRRIVEFPDGERVRLIVEPGTN